MATLIGLSAASDLQYQLLKFYVKTGALSQTTQDKPLLKALRSGAKSFAAGGYTGTISQPVQINFMSDVTGFFAGYTEDDLLTFTQGQNVLRAETNWFEHHAGLEITHTELKRDGILVYDDENTKENPGADAVRITTGVLKNRLEDFGESWARQKNRTCWLDGAQDNKAMPGVLSILTDANDTGTVHGISRATYPAWRHRVLVGASKISASAANQTLTKTLRSEVRQLRRYGGKPDLILCGSGFIDALELEVAEKGVYTQEGFVNEGKTDIGMSIIKMRGVGKFEYDPTLDDLALSKRCYMIDSRRLKLWYLQGDMDRVSKPARPYNAFVLFQSMTFTGAIMATQLNCHGVYEVA